MLDSLMLFINGPDDRLACEAVTQLTFLLLCSGAAKYSPKIMEDFSSITSKKTQFATDLHLGRRKVINRKAMLSAQVN